MCYKISSILAIEVSLNSTGKQEPLMMIEWNASLVLFGYDGSRFAAQNLAFAVLIDNSDPAELFLTIVSDEQRGAGFAGIL